MTDLERRLTERLRRRDDKIEGLEADLADAVETAFRRGAVEWTKSNYPKIYNRLKEADGD